MIPDGGQRALFPCRPRLAASTFYLPKGDLSPNKISPMSRHLAIRFKFLGYNYKRNNQCCDLECHKFDLHQSTLMGLLSKVELGTGDHCWPIIYTGYWSGQQVNKELICQVTCVHSDMATVSTLIWNQSKFHNTPYFCKIFNFQK